MEVLTVGQILSSVPGKFYGDESVRGTVVTNIVHRKDAIKENSVYFIPFYLEKSASDIEQFLSDNLEDITSRKPSLIVIPIIPLPHYV